ncbi:MAG TPA: adenine-specific methyltransferase EcoRI family protein [Promineifilum sp.]|nr:adenine-specific methyltransferase EcoRI family protein [Promineifilum sp.]HRQ14881.1 adenine-specific methyltransferase EcoRI family protein [Promineifilum sp.]
MTTEYLSKAKKNKADEFYTQLADIEAEMRHYKEQFRDKVVFCNCDDPYESNFFKYFALNFNFLGLRKLIATCYVDSPVAGQQLSLFDADPGGPGRPPRSGPASIPHKIEITEVTDENADGAVDLADVEWLLRNRKNALTPLEGDGDFRSPESIKLLKEADIVATNPPFSLFREYVAQLVEYDKEFVIIGNVNAITYKEVFRLIEENRIWLGQSIHSGDREFRVPDSYPLQAAGYRVDENGAKYIRVKGVRWFTNLDFNERHVNLTLYKQYTPEEYPRYDNYDAIEVSRTAEIPYDYDGMMGVPITFLDKYNPDQFEIIGMAKRGAGDPALKSKVYTKEDYKNYSDLNAGPVLITSSGLKNTYPRILIKRKGAAQ